jgi:hypothetical protein
MLNIIKMIEVCPEPYAQYTSKFERTVCTTANTTESRSAFSNMFHNDMDERDSYQCKSRRRRPEPTPATVFSPVYNISVKDSEGNVLGSAHASTAYGMGRIKSKTQEIAADRTYYVLI